MLLRRAPTGAERALVTMSNFIKLVIVAVIGLGILVVAYVARTEFGVGLTDLFSLLN